MISILRDCWNARGVLYAQSVAELRSSVIDTRLGYIWWLLDPLLLMAVYYFVVHGVFGRGGENYPFFVFAGLVAWRWFSRSISLSASAYTRNKGLILGISTVLPIYVLAPILVNGFFALIGLLCLMLVFDVSRLLQLPLLLLVMLVQALLTFGIGLAMAAMTVFVRDLLKFIEYGLRVAFYASPIIYDASRVMSSEQVPHWFKALFGINPFVHLLPAYRALTLGDPVFEWRVVLMVALASLLILQVGAWLTAHFRNQIPQSL